MGQNKISCTAERNFTGKCVRRHSAVVTLLQGGYIDLLQELQDSLLHINVEVIQPLGQSDRYHYLVSSMRSSASSLNVCGFRAYRTCMRIPHRCANLSRCVLEKRWSEDFRIGSVSGSTLVIDYRELRYR